MTTDIERQFFETFGIEPIGCKDNENCTGTLDCRTQCPNAKYPQITDRVLLELICIYSRISNLAICVNEVEELKEDVLEQFIENSEDFKQQVQSLFKERI